MPTQRVFLGLLFAALAATSFAAVIGIDFGSEFVKVC